MGCGSRLAGLFIAVAVFIMGVVTVVMPSTRHSYSHSRHGLSGLVFDFLFMTRAGGVVLILLAFVLLVATVRRK